MKYYDQNPPYFSHLVARHLVSPETIPTQKDYNKVMDNKYIQNVLNSIEAEPLYPIGSLVQVRKTARGTFYRLREQIAMVVDNNGPVTSAAKGAKTYSILPFGESSPIKIQERWLKKKRGGK
jgi:hypothetical protein